MRTYMMLAAIAALFLAVNPVEAWASSNTPYKPNRQVPLPSQAGQSQMSSSSAGLFYPGSIGRVSEAETCSEQTGREKRILLSSPYAIALPSQDWTPPPPRADYPTIENRRD